MNRFSTFPGLSKNRIKLAVISLLVLALVVLGLRLYKDYNISSDEQVERTNGIVSLTYLADQFQIARLQKDPVISGYRHIPKLVEYMDRDYPVGFNLPSAMIERIFNINDDRDVFYLRHFLTYCFYLAGIFAVYIISARRFDNWKMGLLTASFLLLSPRFFAEAFYNSKDIVFMSCFAMATATAISYLLHPKLKTAIWHALACALAMDIRIMAVVLPLLTLAFLGVRVLKSEVSAKTALQTAAIYLGILIALVLLTWPWLWADPLSHFGQAFANMAKFRWNGQMLFDGQLIRSTQLPWNYLPMWIVITTPLLYSCLFVLGALLTTIALIKRGYHLWQSEQELQDLIFLSLFFAPVTAVIVLHSVLYDGWRQMYFIYPAFLLLASKGFDRLWNGLNTGSFSQSYKNRIIKISMVIILGISFISTGAWMIKAHPLQNVYFNSLVGANWKARFDLDYWGLANRQALEWILQNDERAFINVWQGSLSNVSLSIKMLSKAQRERIGVVDRAQDADYILTNYRLNQTDYAKLDHFEGGQFALVHQITVVDEVIESIYRRTQEANAYKALSDNSAWVFTSADQHQTARALLMRSGGWTQPEAWGTWSKGSDAKLVLPWPKSHPQILSLQLNAFISPASLEQKVLVRVDSGPEQVFTLTKASNNQIDVRLPSAQSERMTVNFHFPDATIPKEHGLGGDDRKLAIGLISAAFR
jgi:hypothetical protein